MVTREDVLRTAGDLITGDRQATYGSAKDSHARIADMWSAYLGVDVTEVDVAAMMVLLKVSRSRSSDLLDNWVDVCGYGAIAGELGAGDG
jgi:hypothetical protein